METDSPKVVGEKQRRLLGQNETEAPRQKKSQARRRLSGATVNSEMSISTFRSVD
jgi:hypothetical protein